MDSFLNRDGKSEENMILESQKSESHESKVFERQDTDIQDQIREHARSLSTHSFKSGANSARSRQSERGLRKSSRFNKNKRSQDILENDSKQKTDRSPIL